MTQFAVVCPETLTLDKAPQVAAADRITNQAGTSAVAVRPEAADPVVLLAQANIPLLKEMNPSNAVNLLAPDQGGQALVVPSDEWFKPISGKEDDVATVNVGQEAVYGFKDENPATFSKFSVLILGEDSHNPAQIELLAADDSPTGTFRSIAKL